MTVPHPLAIISIVAPTLLFASASIGAEPSGDDRAVREVFEAADSSSDGKIDEAEFAADTIAAFVSVDRDGDKHLSVSELRDAGVADASVLDADGNGKLSIVEVMNGKIAQFKEVDSNGDGDLTLEEIIYFENSR